MVKSKLSIFFDTLLISFIVFLLSYIWLQKYLKNAILSFFICIFAFLIVFFIIFSNFKNKYNKHKLTKKEVYLTEKY